MNDPVSHHLVVATQTGQPRVGLAAASESVPVPGATEALQFLVHSSPSAPAPQAALNQKGRRANLSSVQ